MALSHKKLSKQFKASIAFFVASLVTSGLSYLTTPIYTRLLTTQEYGRVTVYLTWLQVFGIIAMFCLSYGVFNNGMIDYPEKRDDYAFSMLILSNIITLSFSAILLCLYPLYKSFIKLDLPFIVLMCLIFLFQPAYNFWVARQRYESKYKWVLFWSIVCAVLSSSVAILFCFLSKDGERLYPRIFGAEVTLIVIYIGFYLFIGFKNKWKINPHYWKQALVFNLPLIPHYLSMYLLGSSDKLMISFLIGDTETAYYSVAHSVAAVALIVWSAINASLIPFTYQKCKEKDYQAINKVTLPLVSFFAVSCVLIILCAPEVVKLMAPNNYLDAIYVIPPIVGGVFFQVQYFIYANVLFYHKKPLFVMIGSITAVIANIVLNYFCIKRWGYMAAGYTTIICYGLQALIDYLAMRKVVGSRIYNMKFILLLSIVVIVIALTSSLLYDYVVIRYALLLGLIILAIIFRKRILSVFAFRKSLNGIEETNN